MTAKDSCALVNNDHDFRKLLKAKEKVIALFYASWCPFCSRFLPVFEKHAGQEGAHFVLVQDDGETIADPYSIKIYPTVLFLENGVVSKRLDGMPGAGLNEKQLLEFVTLCALT